MEPNAIFFPSPYRLSFKRQAVHTPQSRNGRTWPLGGDIDPAFVTRGLNCTRGAARRGAARHGGAVRCAPSGLVGSALVTAGFLSAWSSLLFFPCFRSVHSGARCLYVLFPSDGHAVQQTDARSLWSSDPDRNNGITQHTQLSLPLPLPVTGYRIPSRRRTRS